MGLRFIIGRSGTGKTHFCIDEISKKQDMGLNVIYIVPEQFSLQAEKELSSNMNGNGLLYANVITFGRLSHMVSLERGGNLRDVLDESGKSMVLRKVIFEKEDKLLYYKNSIDKRGFMEQLSTTVRELYSYGVNRDKLNELYNSVDDNSVIKMKLNDISTIVSGYEDYIKEKHISADEKFDILARDLKNSSIIKNAHIYIDGFYGFTPQEINVIGELMEFSEEVNITLPMDKYTYYDKNPSMARLFFEPATTAKKIIEKAQEKGIKVFEPTVFYEQKRGVNEGVRHMEKYFNYYPPVIGENSNGVKLFSADNKYDEIENCAINILKMAREENVKFNEIAVLMRNVSDYESYIKSIFSEYNIPFFIDKKEDIISQPVVELIRSIIDIVIKDFSYESMFRFLRTGFSPINREDIDLLENYVLAYGIKSYKWHNETWEYGFKNKDDENKANINRIKNEVLNCLKPFYESVSRDKKYTIGHMISSLYDTLKNMNISSILSDKVNKFYESDNIERAEQYKQAWKIMNEIFEQMTHFLENEVMTVSEFSKIVDAGLGEGKLAIVPPTIDTVTVGDIERTRLANLKAVFVVGANEGVLPSPSENLGIFTDLEREILDNKGVELSPDGKRKAFEEQFLIYTSITRASHYIYISYSKSNTDGRALRPSPFIGRFKSLFKDLDVLEYESTSVENIVSPVPVLHKLGGNIRNIYNGEGEEFWKDVASFYIERKEWDKNIESLRNSIYDKNISEKLSENTMKKVYNGKLNSSISRLERYISCPYSYFIEYILSAKERKLYELGTPDLGSLFHNVLESFSKKMAENKIPWRDITDSQIDDFVNQSVSENAPKLGNEILLSTASHRYLVKRLERISKRATKTLTKHIKSGTFNPYGYEVEFGLNGVMPAITIELSNGEKMIMNGKIDRVDVLDKDGNKYVKIIDYKSGNKEFSLKDVYYGLQLQLIIYIDALMKNIKDGDKDILPAGVLYFKIQDPVIKSVAEMTTEEIENSILKELKMSGLVLKDDDILENLDENLKEKTSKTSDIIPVSYGSDGMLKKTGTSVASIMDYNALMKFTSDKAKSIGENILAGNIDIKPYKSKDKTPCTYCNYHSICRFDINMPENSYNKLRDIKDDDIWQELRMEYYTEEDRIKAEEEKKNEEEAKKKALAKKRKAKKKV